jgi:branched-chain amino acid transport system substrate-binding protein
VVFDAANRDYAENWAQDYATELQRLNGIRAEVIELDSRTPQNPAALSASIVKNEPDLIVFSCSAKTAGRLMRTIRNQHPNVRFAVSAWAANRLLAEFAEQAAEGALVEQYHDLSDKSESYARFAEEYLKRFKLAPDYAAVIAYDATNIVLDGLDENPRRESLKEVLLQKHRFKGLQVPIVLDASGDASRQAFTTMVKNGQFSPIH